MSHRERVAAAVKGQPVDRPPVSLWRHFPVDDQRPDWLAEAHLAFQREWDWDFVKVTPASSFCLLDWGASDEWRGDPEGTREYTRIAIAQPDDWLRLPVLDPSTGALGRQLECLRLIRAGLDSDTPFVQTVFNPLSQAKNLAGRARLLAHLREHPSQVAAGLNTIAETTRRFIEAALQTGIDGIFYAVQHASYEIMSADEYERHCLGLDRELIAAADPLWLNVLHLHGGSVMFDRFVDLPVHLVNWHDRETPPTLAQAKSRFPGAVCGGLRQWETMVRGRPEDVAREASDAIDQTGGRGFILGTGCVTPITAPRANLKAARQSVEPAASARSH